MQVAVLLPLLNEKPYRIEVFSGIHHRKQRSLGDGDTAAELSASGYADSKASLSKAGTARISVMGM
jgi:hypothetical protein